MQFAQLVPPRSAAHRMPAQTHLKWTVRARSCEMTKTGICVHSSDAWSWSSRQPEIRIVVMLLSKVKDLALKRHFLKTLKLNTRRNPSYRLTVLSFCS
ncbi:hypothetical protein GH733_003168 [Mirounga leonina]|nr:hypothetical protein GH733_003168 [Mirounga leonina]